MHSKALSHLLHGEGQSSQTRPVSTLESGICPQKPSGPEDRGDHMAFFMFLLSLGHSTLQLPLEGSRK